MYNITFIENDGTAHKVQADEGQNIMDCALNNSIPQILGDCGGAMACATCHGVIDDAWIDKVGDKDELEAELLEYADGLRPNSRLCCQIIASKALDGLVVHLPVTEY